MTQSPVETEQDGLVDQAAAKVQDAAAVVQEKASEAREEGSVRLRDQFEQRSNQAGAQARGIAEALRRSGHELQGEGKAGAARVTAQAAGGVERLALYLEQTSGDQLMRDAELFARRRPWMLAGLGMIGGVAAARFMKASSEQRYGDVQREDGQRSLARSGSSTAELPKRSGLGGADRVGIEPSRHGSFAGSR